MNRMELIKTLTRRAPAPVAPKPRGLHCATTGSEPVAVAKPKDRKRTSVVLTSGSWGPINRTVAHEYDWLNKPDRKAKPGIKAGHRHEPHALTMIAERLKRRWH